jgi:type IV secretion system protein VirD4
MAASLIKKYYDDNSVVGTLLRAMVKLGKRFGGIPAAIGSRFLQTPPGERGSIFSTGAAQTDFLDSFLLRRTLRRSDFPLRALRADRPTTIFLCLPVGRMGSHYFKSSK